MSLYAIFSRAPVSSFTVGPRFVSRLPYRAAGISVRVAQFTALVELGTQYTGASATAHARVQQQLGAAFASAKLTDSPVHLSDRTDTNMTHAFAAARVLGQPPAFEFGICQ